MVLNRSVYYLFILLVLLACSESKNEKRTDEETMSKSSRILTEDWKKINNELKDHFIDNLVYIENDIMICSGSIIDKDGVRKRAVYRSTSGGRKWKDITANFPKKRKYNFNGDLRSIIYDNATSTVYATAQIGMDLVVLSSLDHGASWSDITDKLRTKGMPIPNNMKLKKSPDSLIYIQITAGSGNESIWFLSNGEWEERVDVNNLPNGLYQPTEYAVGLDKAIFSSLRLGASRLTPGLYRLSKGSKWEVMDKNPKFLEGFTVDITKAKFGISGDMHPLGKGEIIAPFSIRQWTTEDRGVSFLKTTNNGSTWSLISKEIYPQITSLLHASDNYLFALTEKKNRHVGIAISTDGGKTFVDEDVEEHVLCMTTDYSGTYYLGTGKGIYACKKE